MFAFSKIITDQIQILILDELVWKQRLAFQSCSLSLVNLIFPTWTGRFLMGL